MSQGPLKKLSDTSVWLSLILMYYYQCIKINLTLTEDDLLNENPPVHADINNFFLMGEKGKWNAN